MESKFLETNNFSIEARSWKKRIKMESRQEIENNNFVGKEREKLQNCGIRDDKTLD